MHFLTRSVVVAAVVALLVPLVALGGEGTAVTTRTNWAIRLIYATDD